MGAGVSRTLGLPSWQELIDRMAVELGYDPRVFAKTGGFLELAEYYQIEQGNLNVLREWMANEWHVDDERMKGSDVHRTIVELGFPVIYTTNYDRLLELAHETREASFTRVANVGDFTRIRDGVTQIVKLHGDVGDEHSLVLTETSYFDRLTFDSPLDIKLRSDAIGKTILFIGYSLNDVNIRYLLYKLYRLWTDSEFAEARPKSYVFLARPNPVQEAILLRRGIVPIVADVDDPGTGLKQFLEEIAQASFARAGENSQ